MAKSLDKKDWRILHHLCETARISHNKLAKEVGLSKNTLTYRIERLKKKGIISGFFTIINLKALGYASHTLLLRLNKAKETALIDFLKATSNVLVVDRLIGEWNLLIEVDFKETSEFNKFLNTLKTQFSNIIDTYELHTALETYRIEQLPVELMGEKKETIKTTIKNFKIDQLDIKLLSELNKDSTANVTLLAKKLGVTYETISTHIKDLQKKGIITKFTAKISLGALGYDVYLVILNLRNFSKEREKNLKAYLNSTKNIRFSFLSASKPIIFTYLAVKKADELNTFLLDIKEKFSDIIVNQHYLLSPKQIKYSLFPE